MLRPADGDGVVQVLRARVVNGADRQGPQVQPVLQVRLGNRAGSARFRLRQGFGGKVGLNPVLVEDGVDADFRAPRAAVHLDDFRLQLRRMVLPPDFRLDLVALFRLYVALFCHRNRIAHGDVRIQNEGAVLHFQRARDQAVSLFGNFADLGALPLRARPDVVQKDMVADKRVLELVGMDEQVVPAVVRPREGESPGIGDDGRLDRAALFRQMDAPLFADGDFPVLLQPVQRLEKGLFLRAPDPQLFQQVADGQTLPRFLKAPDDLILNLFHLLPPISSRI